MKKFNFLRIAAKTVAALAVIMIAGVDFVCAQNWEISCPGAPDMKSSDPLRIGHLKNETINDLVVDINTDLYIEGNCVINGDITFKNGNEEYCYEYRHNYNFIDWKAILNFRGNGKVVLKGKMKGLEKCGVINIEGPVTVELENPDNFDLSFFSNGGTLIFDYGNSNAVKNIAFRKNGAGGILIFRGGQIKLVNKDMYCAFIMENSSSLIIDQEQTTLKSVELASASSQLRIEKSLSTSAPVTGKGKVVIISTGVTPANFINTGGVDVEKGTLEVSSIADLQSDVKLSSGTELLFSLDKTTGNNTEFKYNISGAGSVTMAKKTTSLTLTGNPSYTGETKLKAGTLQINNDYFKSDLNLSGSTTFIFNLSNNYTYKNKVSGSGLIHVKGNKTFTFSGSNNSDVVLHCMEGIFKIGSYWKKDVVLYADATLEHSKKDLIGGTLILRGGTINLVASNDLNNILKLNGIKAETNDKILLSISADKTAEGTHQMLISIGSGGNWNNVTADNFTLPGRLPIAAGTLSADKVAEGELSLQNKILGIDIEYVVEAATNYKDIPAKLKAIRAAKQEIVNPAGPVTNTNTNIKVKQTIKK